MAVSPSVQWAEGSARHKEVGGTRWLVGVSGPWGLSPLSTASEGLTLGILELNRDTKGSPTGVVSLCHGPPALLRMFINGEYQTHRITK